MLVRRLALSATCGAALAVAAIAPAHQQAAASAAPSAESLAQFAAGTDQGTAERGTAERGNTVSRAAERTAPPAVGQSAIPVREVTPAEPPAAPQPTAPAPTMAPAKAATPAKPKAPAQPALPVIPGLDIYQRENAQTIVDVGRAMGIDERGQIIAVATALQESRLYNLYVAVDHDSLGLFQQRPSTGWGTPAEITTPSYAARAFYNRLLDTTSDWGCLTCAAQRVQGSAFPDAYAAQEWLATTIVDAFYKN
ncbi:hypothetical protein [Rugosimonospora acidiphila]|uniref:hypothetical protein n=1 Tax=Rugosimonospora acidiphila TaxID=556531 RepID=UPI0031ED229B